MREHPILRSQYLILAQISTESPRGMVLVAAAELDRLLLDLMKAYLKPGAGQNELLTLGQAPLGTFSSKIAAAHALNLISDVEFRDLGAIRRVRNGFAHDTIPNFENQSIVDRLRSLSQFREGDPPIDVFETAVIKLAFELSALIKGVQSSGKLPAIERQYVPDTEFE